MTHQLFTHRLFTRLVGILASVMLVGCASHRPAPPIADWQQHQNTLQQQQHWQLSAKIGVRTPDDSGSAYLVWQQAPEDFDIHLSGPLGQGSVHIYGTAEQVVLEQAGKPDLNASSAEALLQQALGWSAPLTELQYWVRGIPAPGSHAELTHDTQGTLQTLKQQGWQLSYSRYRTQGAYLLPGKITAIQGEIKLTLIIKKWAFEPNV